MGPLVDNISWPKSGARPMITVFIQEIAGLSPISQTKLAVWDGLNKRYNLARPYPPFQLCKVSLGEQLAFFRPWGGAEKIKGFWYTWGSEIKSLPEF